jgi:hypothetical protein
VRGRVGGDDLVEVDGVMLKVNIQYFQDLYHIDDSRPQLWQKDSIPPQKHRSVSRKQIARICQPVCREIVHCHRWPRSPR